MTEDVIEVKKPVSMWKLRFMGAFAAASGLVAVVSAGELNNSTGPLLDQLPALFTALVALVIAAVPIENLSPNMASIQNQSPFGFVFGDYHCAVDCGIPSRTV